MYTAAVKRRQTCVVVLISQGNFIILALQLAKGVFVLKLCVWGGGVWEGKELAVMGRKGGCPDLSS